MKKYFVFFSVSLLFLSTGCNQKKIDRLQAIRDSLMVVTNTKDANIGEFVAAFNDIQANLDSIKKLENVIDQSTSRGEVRPLDKEQIKSDIAWIYQLQVKNCQKMAELNSKLKKSGRQSAELEKMIANLNKTINEKDSQIASLTDELGKLNIQVNDLQARVTGLGSKADSLSADSKDKSRIIDERTAALHTGYYVMGTNKELKDKKIITATGGFLGIGRTKVITPNADMSSFTRVDITQATEIPLMAKKVTLVTPHPSASYRIEGENNADRLLILDPDQFWSQSKALVMVTR